MKKSIILGICLLNLSLAAQYVPEKVHLIMEKRADVNRPIDTVYFENYRYVFSVKGDSNLTRWELTDKTKLWFDGWKAAGLSYFGLAMGSMFVLPHALPSDKILHVGAGVVIGGLTTWAMWRYTSIGVGGHKRRPMFNNHDRFAFGWKSKLASAGIGFGAGAAVGLVKEYAWDKNRGGTVSIKDAIATSIGAAVGAVGGVIWIGNKTKRKAPIQYEF
jgi:hypothetical protein